MMIPLVTKRTDSRDLRTLPGFLTLIDKPVGWSSFDVCKKIRHITGIKKVGHGGTLDPFATGLMTIGVGRGTKSLTEITGRDKRYRAGIRFGLATDSFDITGTITHEMPDFELSREAIAGQLETLTGKIMQLPPMFSAKKVKGRRLYASARKGIEVERPAVEVHVYRADILEWTPPLLTVDFHVSKGTYIRALAHDLGRALKVPAVLESLRRTHIGEYDLDEALTMEQFNDLWKRQAADG